jgi:hypothetical protein
MPIIRSASEANLFAPGVPVAPAAPRFEGWLYGKDPFPAKVSATGIPACSAIFFKISVASL